MIFTYYKSVRDYSNSLEKGTCKETTRKAFKRCVLLFITNNYVTSSPSVGETSKLMNNTFRLRYDYSVRICIRIKDWDNSCLVIFVSSGHELTCRTKNLNKVYDRRVIQKVLLWTASIRKNNVCLTDFVPEYSSFYHTCTYKISKESSKYQYSYWHLKLPQSYTLAYIWRWKGGKRWNRKC